MNKSQKQIFVDDGNNKITYKMYVGMLAEKLIVMILKSLGWDFNHTDFYNYSHYNDNRCPDIWNDTKKIYAEIKNIHKGKYRGIEWVEREILNRYPPWAEKKLLFISHKSILTKKARELLENENVIIIEYGEYVNVNYESPPVTILLYVYSQIMKLDIVC